MRDLHLHLHAAAPATVAAVVCLGAPMASYSSTTASKVFPKAVCQQSFGPSRSTALRGAELELRSLWLLRLVTGHAVGHRQRLMLSRNVPLCPHSLHLEEDNL